MQYEFTTYKDRYCCLGLFIYMIFICASTNGQGNKDPIRTLMVIGHKEAFNKSGSLIHADDTLYVYYTPQYILYKLPAMLTQEKFSDGGKKINSSHGRIFYYFVHEKKASLGYKFDSLKIFGRGPALDSLNQDVTNESVDSFRIAKGINGEIAFNMSYLTPVSKTESGNTLIARYASSITEKNDVDTIVLHYRKPDDELPIAFSNQLDSLFPPRKLVKYEIHLRRILKGALGSTIDLPARRMTREILQYDEPATNEILAIIERFKRLKAEKGTKR